MSMIIITSSMNPIIPKKGPSPSTSAQGTCTFIPQIPEARVKGMKRVATAEKILMALSML